ncbi:MAG: hypothetical protein WCA09_09345, partial [Burkholderiales bacterium]
ALAEFHQKYPKIRVKLSCSNRALVMLTPDIGEQYFREVGTVVGAGGPPDRSKLLEVMSRYGLVAAAQS